MKVNRPQLAGIAIAVAVVIFGKHYYRNASADEIAWLLAPTAHLVSAATGADFVREAGAGWIDRDIMFLIAPVCAGCQFLFAGFFVTAIAWLGQMRTWPAMAQRLAIAAACAYLATLAVNAIRISIAVWMHAARVSSGDWHRLEGIAVYLGGLCALYALATSTRRAPTPVRSIDRASRRAAPWRAMYSRYQWLAVPMAIYVAMTLVLPALNGAWVRPGFARHAAVIGLSCGVVAGFALAHGAAGRLAARLGRITKAGRTGPSECAETTHRQSPLPPLPT